MKKNKRNLFKFKRAHLAMPYTIISIIFVIVPLFFIIYYGFTGADGSFTFNNFSKFAEPSFWATLRRSFLMALLTTLICLAIAYPLAMALTRLGGKNKKTILVMLFVLPMWINSLLRITAIKLLLGEVIDKGFFFSLIGMVYDFLPFMLLPIYNILSDMDDSVLEASYDLGANTPKTFVKVKLPLSTPGIISGILMVFMPTVSTFAVTDILGNPNSVLFGNIINRWFSNTNPGAYNIGSAFALVLLALILITMLVANLITRGKAQIAGNAGGSNL